MLLVIHRRRPTVSIQRYMLKYGKEDDLISFIRVDFVVAS